MFGKHRRDYDRFDDEDGDEADSAGVFIKPLRLTRVDWGIAAFLAVLSALAVHALSWHGLHPDAWSDCAVACGLRPALSVCPGFWRVLAGAVYAVAGIEAGSAAIVLLGKVAVGLVVALWYLTFRNVIATLIRIYEPPAVWRRVLTRLVPAVSAILLLCSDPIWTLGYAFTPSALTVLMFSIEAFLFSQFIVSGTVRPAYLAMVVAGLLCAETPLGAVSLAAFWLVFYVLLNKGSTFHVQLLDPLRQQSSKWYLTGLWAAGLLVGVAIDVLGFAAFDGMAATGLTYGGVPLAYVSRLWHMFTLAATPGGWVTGLAMALLPFILGIALLRRACDLEYFLAYHVGIVFFVAGCIAYSQLASLQPLWFWTLSPSTAVHSPVLLALCAFMSATAVLCALTVIAVDAYCRNHRHIALQLNPDIVAEAAPTRARRALRNAAFASVALLLVAGAVPLRLTNRAPEMLDAIDAFVRETVDEADGATWLFTDGAFDCAIEMESARRGGSLACISLIPGRGSRTAYSVKQTMGDDEDRLSAEVGGSNVLRTWQRDKPERIAKSAMQLGLELWRVKSAREYPPVSGVLARTAWPSEDMRRKGIDGAYSLVERILTFYAMGGIRKSAGKAVNDLFVSMQWRLARLAKVRSEMFDRAGDVARATAEMRISDALDDQNESLKRILEGMTRLREHTMRQMTPREGLHFALVRADFALARRYAEPILDADADDVDANFGMGMSYLMQAQYGRAEEFLTRCLKRNSKEPAIWNNIAVVQLHLGRYADARKNALHALSLLPDSAEIKDTLKKIDETEKAEGEKPAQDATGAEPASGAAPASAGPEGAEGGGNVGA